MLEAATQQLRRQLLNANTARKHSHHSLNNGHLHAVTTSQLSHHRRRLNRLSGLAHMLVQAVRGNTLSQQAARRVVTRQRRRAGRNQVAHTGKTAHRRSLTAQRHRQAGNLRQTARHNGRLRVIAVIAALANTHAEGNHVLHQATNFSTNHIRVGVRAEVTARNRVSNSLSHRQGTSRNHGGGRLLPHDFLRQVRARKHAHAVRNMADRAQISTTQSHRFFQLLGNDLRHAQTRTGLQPLR